MGEVSPFGRTENLRLSRKAGAFKRFPFKDGLPVPNGMELRRAVRAVVRLLSLVVRFLLLQYSIKIVLSPRWAWPLGQRVAMAVRACRSSHCWSLVLLFLAAFRCSCWENALRVPMYSYWLGFLPELLNSRSS